MSKTILVNKDNKIKDSYFKRVKLIDITDKDGKPTKIEEETYNNYQQLEKCLLSKNIIIGIDSAYRSIEEQQELYNEFLEKYGKDYTEQYVALPTTSEHHTGLAIDISIKENGVWLDSDEHLEEKYQEIHKCLKDFGFILRYPKNKEKITSYQYEPWHIRYVGKFVANIIYENNYTLEEYLTSYGGIVLINKEKDMTSFDVVNDISKLFGIKRVGHTGTLDPLATGVLIIAIGQATKVVELLTATYKEYIAEVKLGIKTDTLDITGYPYEPWHIRYVGKFVAKIISENNYTLEEYLNEFSAVILVNKEQNMTSFDVVNEISHLFGIKKVGHTGTLDPLAEGVLIVAIGQSTKVVELLTATYKEYIAKVKLGILTDTLDITGNLIKEEEIPENLDIEKVIRNFKKTYMQEVPIYSAVKVNGKKLYEYARNNEKVTLPTKEVTIKEIELLSKTSDTFEFKTTVSKGCYIRSLINDIAQELNTIGVMSELTRTKQGNISLEQTSTLQEIKQGKYKIYDIDQVLEIPVIKLNDFLSKKVKSGHKLNNTWNIKNKVIFKDENNKILGIYENNDNILKTWKNFV